MNNILMDRRQFLTLMSGAALGGAIGSQTLLANAALASSGPTIYQSSDLASWETVLGDGLWTAPGQNLVNGDDVTTDHYGDHSTLSANRHERGVMAHNITFNRIIDTTALQHAHVLSYSFRLPYIPMTWGSVMNAQTLEGGFFIWDGAGSRLDYGVAFQWILNPWMSSFGEIRTWSSGGYWVSSGVTLPVDTEWHQLTIALDPYTQSSSLEIDAVQIPISYSQTPKAGWGNEVASRLQAEIISIWPGANAIGPKHQAEFKDWQWEWYPLVGE